MVDGRQDMEGWGVYSILKEAGRLLNQHIRILRPFILAFLLPLALVLFLEVIGLTWVVSWVADEVQTHHLGGIFDHHRHSGFHAFHATIFKAPNPSDLVPIFLFVLVVLAYTLTFLIAVISWLLVSLAAAAIAKAIHHIYSSPNEEGNSSKTRTRTHSIFTSLPHSLYRIFIISLCFFVVDITSYFLFALPFYFLSGPQFEPYLSMLHTFLWNLVFLILDFWFLVSVQVVVLESHYDGWAALQRSAKLMKAKAATAFGLVAVYIVSFAVLDAILLPVGPADSVIFYVVILYMAGALAAGHLALAPCWLVVVTVFYFVSKRKYIGGGEEGRQAEGDLYQALDVESH